MIKTTQISDGRSVELVDLDQITHEQGFALATAAADVLIRSGMIRADAGLNGPQLLMFLSELGDYLASQRSTFVVNATYDGDGPSEAIGTYPSRTGAIDEIVHLVTKAAEAKGVTVTDAQRETLRDTVSIRGAFSGVSYRPTGAADEVSLKPIRDALGWTDYDIYDTADVPGTGTPAKSLTPPAEITIRGVMQFNSSKCLLRYVDLHVSEPYDHEAHLRIEAMASQDDDSLNAALDDLYDEEVVIKASLRDGSLYCTSDDITLA